MAPSWVAALLKLKFEDIEAVTRLADQDVRLRHGQIESKEKVYWADKNVFEVLPLPVFRGDLNAALRRPDGIVLPRNIARKYFGRDDPIGESMLIDGAHLMIVTAVIEDLPNAGTQLESGIFASGVASHSLLTQWDSDPRNNPKGPGLSLGGRTYLRLAPNASMDRLQMAMPAFVKDIYPLLPPGLGASLQFIRIDQVSLFPGLNPAVRTRLAVIAIAGVLILVIACLVFINLSTARSARRALEVGVRKAVGANRGALVLQFLGESLIHVAMAAVVAAALTELLIPRVNTFLNSGASFDYWRDPTLLAWMGLGVFTVGILAGVYPAFVLSAFRPVSVLKGSMFQSGGAVARQCLVALQFLIGLLIAAGVVYQQRIYATRDALRVNADEMLIIRSPCNTAFETEVRALPGVRGAFCSTDALLSAAVFGNYRLKDGSVEAIDMVGVEFGLLDLYGLKPLAGRFSPSQNGNDVPSAARWRFIVNEAAARRFGFASPSAAVGQALPFAPSGDGSLQPEVATEIVGVVPDFSIHAVEHSVKPAIYYMPSAICGDGALRDFQLINVKLAGRDIPETLEMMDRLWPATGGSGPIDRFFLNDYIQNLYLGMLREAQVFSVFSGVAVLLACLGLVGLSASATERRTKEIGIRKAMGAGSSDIVRLLVWEFTRPVLCANAIAWPAAAFFMNRWLHGFAYHVELQPWLFIAATVLALLVALLTVSVQSYRVARAEPISALRYE
jgi:putative ABC transport system permease protein